MWMYSLCAHKTPCVGTCMVRSGSQVPWARLTGRLNSGPLEEQRVFLIDTPSAWHPTVMSFASLHLASSPHLTPCPSSCAQTLWFSFIKFSFKTFYCSFRIKKTWPPCCLYCPSGHWISLPLMSDILWTNMGPVAISLFGSVPFSFSTASKEVKSSAMLPSFFSSPLGLLETAGRNSASLHVGASAELEAPISPLTPFADFLVRGVKLRSSPSPSGSHSQSLPFLSPRIVVSYFTQKTEVIRADSCQLPVSLQSSLYLTPHPSFLPAISEDTMALLQSGIVTPAPPCHSFFSPCACPLSSFKASPAVVTLLKEFLKTSPTVGLGDAPWSLPRAHVYPLDDTVINLLGCLFPVVGRSLGWEVRFFSPSAWWKPVPIKRQFYFSA